MGNMLRKFGRISHIVFELCELIDKQTDSTIVRTPSNLNKLQKYFTPQIVV